MSEEGRNGKSAQFDDGPGQTSRGGRGRPKQNYRGRGAQSAGGRGTRSAGRFGHPGGGSGASPKAKYTDYVFQKQNTDEKVPQYREHELPDSATDRFQQDYRNQDTGPRRGGRGRGGRGGHVGNWRQRTQDENSQYSREQPNQQSEQPLGEISPVDSHLNAQAQPFVPQTSQKPNPSKNMTKLGKVKPRRRNNVNTQGETDRGAVRAPADRAPGDRAPAGRREDIRSAPARGDKSDALNLVRQFTTGEPSAETSQMSNTSADSRQNKVSYDNFGGRQSAGSNSARSRNSRDYRQQGQVMPEKQRRRAQKQNHESNSAPERGGERGAERGGKGGEREWSEKEAQRRVAEDERKALLHRFEDKKPLNPLNYENHREHLTENLINASYECTICYGAINQDAAIWSCGKCYHMFHFYCLKKWANTLVVNHSDQRNWRCPTCQEQYSQVPHQYRCFCTKIRDPVWNKHDTPHSCGEVCGKKRKDNCKHPCNELCHPGPCPPCNAYISKHCNCRRSYQKVKCNKQVDVKCSQVCNKKKNCSIHTCDIVCHSGSCPPCEEIIIQGCHCREVSRDIICGSAESRLEGYSCGKICGKALKCGNHTCTKPCHTGDCAPCATAPEVILTCNCGKSKLSEISTEDGVLGIVRTSCLDKIPTCGNICGKKLDCGGKGGGSAPHTCQRYCHDGECECKLTTKVTCRCKIAKTVSLPCVEARKYTDSNPYKCEKKCTKMRSCAKHRCGQPCCVAATHPCMQICGKRLSCGEHKCTELCHIGPCPTCYNVGFDELRCTCGIAVTYPPIPCGTKPPQCYEMCTRNHLCTHPIIHYCHSEEKCPPCVVLTQKLCMGGHEMRNNIPCYITDITCGKSCGQTLPCGDHKCLKTCHKGDCGEDICRQPCPKPRPSCGHPCAAECHPGEDCPTTDCKQPVMLRCACGNRKEKVLCYMTAKRLSSSAFAVKMKELNSGVNISELMNAVEKKQLECDEDCAQSERNRRMASALEIINPEILQDLAAPQFSEFLTSLARMSPAFIADIEKALCDLVKSAQQSKQDMRSHVFPPMRRKQRQAVHELAELYGCGTISYDEEPQRNVVAMAHKGKCELPSQTLTAYIKCERHPRPPVPMPVNANEQQIRMKSQETLLSTEVKTTEPKIDYFDMT